MAHFIGLDVSMKETTICVKKECGKIIAETTRDTDPQDIANFIQRFEDIKKIGLESGSLSHWLTRELRQIGLPAICVDAKHLSAFLSTRINKTDRNDAEGIADAMRANLYKEVYVKSPQALEIKALLNTRRLLIEQTIQVKNHIRGLLKIHGIRLGVVGRKTFIDAIQEAMMNTGDLFKLTIQTALNSYQNLLKEFEVLDRAIRTIAKKEEAAKLLMTMPGIGPVTAMAYLGEIGDPNRFTDSNDVGAFFGLTPTQYSSGEINRQGAISKQGPAYVRNLLFEAAVVMLTRTSTWNNLKAWGLKIMRRHGFKKAAAAVARKIAVILHQMLIKNEKFKMSNKEKIEVQNVA